MRKLNSRFDSFARPQICLFHWRHFSAFHVWGVGAFVLAVVAALTLVGVRGLSPKVMTMIIVAVPLTVFSLGMVIKISTGEEQHVHYHHVIAIMLVSSFILLLLGQPILSYLDIMVAGIGIFVAVGRVGCFKVGCCHGTPSSWGVAYRQEHADAGFAPYYVGVRLFPAQLIEALWAFVIVGAGTVLFINGPPGAFLAWYVVTYGLGRFWIEFVRGDPERPYLFGYSEAQWTSLFLMCAITLAEYAGWLPMHAWHAVATASVAFAMIAIALKKSFQCATARHLLYPLHIKEVAEAIDIVTKKATEFAPRLQFNFQQSDVKQISVASTSLGIQFSASKIKNRHDESYHYAFSHCDGGMTGETARLLAQLIISLRRAKSSPEILAGNNGVFHLFIPSHRENELGHS